MLLPHQFSVLVKMKKIFSIMFIMLITGCGFKGPLYLPNINQNKIESSSK